MDPKFPFVNPAKVRVTTASGTFEWYVTAPWGEPDNSPDKAELVAKLHTLAQGRISQQQVEKIVSAIKGLRDGMAKPLLDALTSD